MSTAPTAVAASQTDIMRPLNASSCNKVVCVSVSGVGTYVDNEVITAATPNGKLAKYVYAQDDSDKYWEATPSGGAHSKKFNIWTSFTNNSRFCGGAAPDSTPADHSDSLCFTIHN
ncbi:hypothetical protein [Streptomyces sp. LN785]|uniref:hypothetical protein n=1 Tax=Streptomyces sp. LN785 TaxID=3112983 RepID=UPI00371AEA6A